MRFARIAFGLLLALVGLLVTFAGAVAAFWLVGPDNTVDTGEQHLTSKGLAVMTAPDLLDRHGPTLHVTASAQKPVFVGVGQDIDVASYLGASQYTRVVRFDAPAKFDTQEMKGGAAALSQPDALDWWIVKASGAGKQSIAWPIADGRYDVVVLNADGSPAVDAKVVFGVELDGAFVTCLLILGAGVVLLVVGLLMMFLRKRKTPAPPVPVMPSPMPYTPPTYQNQGGVRRVAGGLAVGASLLLVATGCVAVPEKNTASETTTRPAVTLADGQAVIKRYNELNNKANQARDAKQSEAIEGDPTLAQTRAGYQIDRKLDADGKKKIKPFTYTDPQIGAPEFASYPMRFVVTSGVSDDPASRQLGVWQRQTAGTPWVLTNSVYPAAAMKLPPMDGLRVPSKEDMAKLPVLPQTGRQRPGGVPDGRHEVAQGRPVRPVARYDEDAHPARGGQGRRRQGDVHLDGDRHLPPVRRPGHLHRLQRRGAGLPVPHRAVPAERRTGLQRLLDQRLGHRLQQLRQVHAVPPPGLPPPGSPRHSPHRQDPHPLHRRPTGRRGRQLRCAT